MRPRDFPHRRLMLRRRYQIVPVSPSEVWLYHPTETSLRLGETGPQLLSIVQHLVKGTTWRDLEAATEGEDREWVEAAEQVILELEAVGAMARFVDVPAELSEPECRRFERALDYFSKFETEECSRFDYLGKLRRAQVLMLGLGSLGSSTLPHLVAAGVGRITGVDMDRVEIHNLTRSTAFGDADVGKAKSEVAARLVAEQSAFTSIHGLHRELDSANSISHLLSTIGPVDLVVLTADHPIWRISVWTATACRMHGVPLIRGNRFGIGPLTLPDGTACPACAWPVLVDQQPQAAELVERQRQFGGSPGGVMSPEIGIAASLLARECLSFLTGAGEVNVINAQLNLDLDTVPTIRRRSFPRDPRCAVCGSKETTHAE